MMKYLVLLGISILLSTCDRAPEDGELPDDTAALQQVLRERRAELRDLTQQVEEIEDKLAELDPSFAPQATLVAYEAVRNDTFTNYAVVQATVQAEESAQATPEIPGRILQMNFEEGDPIRKGQLVAVLDVESTETQRAELETALSLAKTVYERQERLWEQNIGSELQYLEAKNNYERLQQQLKSFDVQTAKRNIYAPLTGTVDRVFMRTGEAAMPGAPILNIISTSDLRIVADAPEDLLTKVRRGEQVRVRVPAVGLAFDAPVVRVGSTVDAANRTFAVEVDVPRRYVDQLKANLLAEVEVQDFSAEDVVVVNQDNIQQEVGGQRYVFLAQENEEGELIARKTYVSTGTTYSGRVVVEDGLQPGARLITQGARGLTDGQPISISQNPISRG